MIANQGRVAYPIDIRFAINGTERKESGLG